MMMMMMTNNMTFSHSGTTELLAHFHSLIVFWNHEKDTSCLALKAQNMPKRHFISQDTAQKH